MAMAVQRLGAAARRDKRLPRKQAKLVKDAFGEPPGNVQC
jgi:hypothetical protein